MKAEVVSCNVAVTMTKAQFLKKFVQKTDDGTFAYLKRYCPDCKDINYDAQFGPYVFFTADAAKVEEAKKQMLQAIKELLA